MPYKPDLSPWVQKAIRRAGIEQTETRVEFPDEKTLTVYRHRLHTTLKFARENPQAIEQAGLDIQVAARNTVLQRRGNALVFAFASSSELEQLIERAMHEQHGDESPFDEAEPAPIKKGEVVLRKFDNPADLFKDEK